MSELEYDWTDAGDAHDHADNLDRIALAAAKRGRYEEAGQILDAAHCIRDLAEAQKTPSTY